MRMKKYFIFIFFITFLTANSVAGNLKAYFTYCTFNSPDNGPYIETYLSVIGESAIYSKNETNKFQSTIEVTFIFKQGEEIKKFKKYNLLSPEILDSSAEKASFMDQQRIALPNGVYEFEITIKDLNSSETPFKSTQILTIAYPQNKISISDIELIESLKKTETKSIITKSGYDILPYTSDFYPESFDKIAFYSEIYNTNKVLGENESFLITYYIETYETNKIAGNYKSFSKESAKTVTPLLKSFTIEKLPSGNYNLVVEARDKNNLLLTKKKVFFQRSNPKSTPLLISNDYLTSFVAKMSKKELDENIKSIEPISTNVEINFAQNQLKGKDEELMRQYFYNFWVTRNELEPEVEWYKYSKKVATTNKLFSTPLKKGFNTDRGIIYLKYGEPNTRTEVTSEPNSYPYEIWHYYKVEKFSNKRFIFYDPDLGSNEYPLLHSTMPGYINYPQWKVQLHKRTLQPIDMDTDQNGDHYGGRSTDYYNNPR